MPDASFRSHRSRPLVAGIHLALLGGLLASAPVIAHGAAPGPSSAASSQDTTPAAPSEAEPLKGVITTAQALPPRTTEGTDSYTTTGARTATPLGLSLKQTPQSVSVVTRQRMRDQNINTVLDVVDHAIGLSGRRVETNRATFSSRGFYIRRLMIDGVSNSWGQASGWNSQAVISGSLAFYDRVELVRGANGLMSGTGSPSASINLVHKHATSRTLSGNLQVNAGTWNRRGAVLDLSTPLNTSGSVRGRVVAGFKNGDSWIDRYGNQRDFAYATVDADLTDRTTLWLGASYQNNQSNAPMWGGLPIWHHDGTRTDYPRSKSTAPYWSQWDSQNRNAFVRIQHHFGNGWQAGIRYSYGQRKYDSHLLFASGNPDPLGTFLAGYRMNRDFDSYSIKASGPFDLLGRTHEAAFGYIHNQQSLSADQHTPQSGYPSIADFENYTGSFPEPVWNTHPYASKETTQQAFYGVARFNVADPWHVIVGARFNRFEKTGHGQYIRPFDIKHAMVVTPYAGVVFDVTGQISAYASYTDIFQPQNKRDVNARLLDPIVGKSTEVGIKGSFLDERLNTSLAVFRIKQDNLGQPSGKFINGDPQRPAYYATQGATSKGFEMQLSGRLAEGWQASFGYTQFKLEDAQGKAVNTLFPTRLLKLFTRYRLPGTWRKLTIGGGVTWQNDSYTYLDNPAGQATRISQDGYSLVSLMARYDISQRLSAQLNVGNALDKKYYNIYGIFGAITYGAPRHVNVSVRYRF